MPAQTYAPLAEANQAIVKFRGAYARWSALHHLRYHELLVLDTIRTTGFCTQKMVSDRYLLPRQTVHNVISGMRERGLLQISRGHCTGREKAFVLTEAGRSYAAPLLADLTAVERAAAEQLGAEKLQAMAGMLTEFHQALDRAMESGRSADSSAADACTAGRRAV